MPEVLIQREPKLRIARGPKARLPQPPNSFEEGRAYFCEDTQELFVGAGLTEPMKQVRGQGGDANFFFTQSTPATTWVIPHNLDKHPAVTIEDSTHRQVFAEVHFDSNNQVTVDFNAPESGYVSCN